jgi:HEAT repeat protein
MELENAMSSPAEEAIADLRDSAKPLRNSRLVELSNLDSEELGLLEQAWTAIEPKRRRQIVYRLVELGEDNVELNFDSIFKNCLKDQDAEVRCKAIEGLWENEETSLINPLINLLEHDSSEKVQAATAIALGKFAVLAEHEKLRSCHKSKICQALFAVIDDKSKPIELKRHALEAVSPLSLPRVNRAIMEVYQSSSPEFKVSAVYAMGKNCDPSWLPILLGELANTDAEMRYEAVTACGELGEEEATASVIKLVDDPDTDVQLAAIQALGKIGGSEAKSCLEECLHNPSELIRQATEQTLQELATWEDPLAFKF